MNNSTAFAFSSVAGVSEGEIGADVSRSTAVQFGLFVACACRLNKPKEKRTTCISEIANARVAPEHSRKHL